MGTSEKYCRLCLTLDRWESAVPIFEGNPFKESLSEIIGSFTGVEISANDGLPNVICHKCLGQLTFMVGFKEEIMKNDRFLRNTFSNILDRSKESLTVLQPSKVGNVNNVGMYKMFNQSVEATKLKQRKKPGPKPKVTKISLLQSKDSEGDILYSRNRHPLVFCELCNRPFSRSKEKTDHVKMLHSNPSVEHYSCNYCCMAYMDKISVDCHKKLFHPHLTEEVFLQKKKMIEATLKKNPTDSGDSKDNTPANESTFSHNDFDLIEEIKGDDKSTPGSKRKRPTAGGSTNKVKRSKGLTQDKENCVKKLKITFGKAESTYKVDDNETTENNIYETVVEVHAAMNSSDSTDNIDGNKVENSEASSLDKDCVSNETGELEKDTVKEDTVEDDEIKKNSIDKSDVDKSVKAEDVLEKSIETTTNSDPGNLEIVSENLNHQQTAEIDLTEKCDDLSAGDSAKLGNASVEIKLSKITDNGNGNLSKAINDELLKLDSPGNRISSPKSNDNNKMEKDIRISDEKKVFVCNVCSTTFNTMKDLFYHKKTHK